MDTMNAIWQRFYEACGLICHVDSMFISLFDRAFFHEPYKLYKPVKCYRSRASQLHDNARPKYLLALARRSQRAVISVDSLLVLQCVAVHYLRPRGWILSCLISADQAITHDLDLVPAPVSNSGFAHNSNSSLDMNTGSVFITFTRVKTQAKPIIFIARV
ncbi:hypothetical protein EVAR_84104_1 [Eumeta japonica]|uniref:Uncharacterized protein n=1 Tax=Eumeta variegata TaxID=151549 RepID=A0A4C1UYW8_EUMVA|nr:hypothetical protein EVAR_84104_1 [Eumeta japonica]